MKSRITLFLIFFSSALFSQQEINDFQRDKNTARFGFYNLENLFDVENDSVKRDDEFTPEGAKYWNKRKYYKKLNDLSRVIVALGGWELPDVVGLCELENERVLKDLIWETPLKGKGYRIIHFESPDRRGIDVAIIYRKERVELLKAEPISIQFPWDSSYKTRDILYAQLLLFGTDTLHYFVNHWPSKWGGHMETEMSRMFVASVLRNKVTEIQRFHKNANILIMGDLNDTPVDKSVNKSLGALTDSSGAKEQDLINLSFPLQEQKKGTHKFQSDWSVIDQVIASKNLLNDGRQLRIKEFQAYILESDFLLIEDEKFRGSKPNRTYLGMKYIGGYSDHLPVYLDVVK